jgi:hypothetical protein
MWSDKSLYDRIMERQEQISQKIAKFNVSRDVIAQLFRPDLSIDDSKDGDFFGENIYESTGVWALDTMVKGFLGNTISQQLAWIMYIMGQYELRGIDELDIWLQDIKDHMAEVYRKSTFYDIMPQFTKEAFSIGSPVIFGDEDVLEGRIIWSPIYYKNAFVMYSKYNDSIGVIVKDKKWTARQIYDDFIPKDKPETYKTKFSKPLVNAIDEGRCLDEFEIIRAVFRSDDQIWKSDKFKKPVGNHKYLSVYFEYGTDRDKNTPLQIKPYFSKPFVVWDYEKKPWESCSRTPAFYAIWDTQGQQQFHKNVLENIQLQNRKPLVAPNTMEGKLQIWPEGVMYVNNNEYDRPPKPIDTIGDFFLNPESRTIFKENVERHFHLEEFTRFNNLAKNNKQPVSALQIAKMAGENSVLLSPAIESQGRVLKVIDDRSIEIESRAGRGPFAPDVMGNITDIIMNNIKTPANGISILPQFIGRLFIAQKLAQGLDPIQQGLEAVSPLIQAVPDLINIFRPYKLADNILTTVSFPKNAMVTEDEYNEIIANINQQRQQDAETEKAIEMAKAAKGVSGPVDPKSIIAGMSQMAGTA